MSNDQRNHLTNLLAEEGVSVHELNNMSDDSLAMFAGDLEPNWQDEVFSEEGVDLAELEM